MKKADFRKTILLVFALSGLGLPACDRIAKEIAQRIAGGSDGEKASEPVLPQGSNPPLRDTSSDAEGLSGAEIVSAMGKSITPSERIEAARLNVAKDPHAAKHAKFNAEVRGQFDEKQFDLLEETATALLQSREKINPVTWKLSLVYHALDARHSKGEAGFLNDLAIHKEWENAYPESDFRRIVLANLLLDYAWHARGVGYASSVKEEQWELFRSRIKQAEQELILARENGTRDPEWYRSAMVVMKAQNLPTREISMLQAQCARENPDYYPAAAAALVSFLPRWGGSPGEWEEFAKRVSDESETPDLMYAYLISSIADYEDAATAAEEKTIDWERFKKGMDLMVTMDPESKYYPNVAAFLGVHAGDRGFSAKYFKNIGDEYIPDVWDKPEKFVKFRSWAKTEEGE
jgi:hypothetical protein